MNERRFVVRLPQGDMAGLAWGDPARPPDVLWLHANGFNAATYRQVLSPLSERLHVLAVDLRGHGRSTLPAPPHWRRDWSDLRDDVVALLDRLDAPPLVLAGHSMGGTTGLLASARRPGRVRALALFDPVIMARPPSLRARSPLGQDTRWRRSALARSTLRRRAVFDSREQAFAAYRGRGAFRGWPDAMLADYLEDGLRERPGGDVELACSPAWEASNFAAHGHDPWRALAAVRAPVTLLRAEHGSTCRVGTGAGFARRGPPVTQAVVAGASHFLPMERPELVRETLLGLAD